MGGGTYDLRKVRIFPGASLALSPEFVTNTLLGLSWPVGKGPRGLPEKPPPLLGSGTFTLGDGGK